MVSLAWRALLLGHPVDDVDRTLNFHHPAKMSFHLFAIVSGGKRPNHEVSLLDQLSAGITQVFDGILFHSLPLDLIQRHKSQQARRLTCGFCRPRS
jgi:hypothetical protein